MNTNGSLLLRALLVASLPAVAAAQAPAPAPAAAPAATATPAPLPTPAPEVQKLAFLVGDWVHDETFQPGPMGPGGTGKGRSKSALALGDHHVYTIYTTNSPMGKLEARGFFGWDGEKKTYTMSWFDNMGMATVFTGNFDAEGTLVLERRVHPPGHAGEGALLHQEAAGREARLPERDAGSGRRVEDRDGIGRDGGREVTAFRG